ncbi:MAG: type II toxin-antitoxin system RelE/ParE family toxin [Bacteroidota bacterium]
MAFEVNFTKRADRDFENILDYIEDKFGTQATIHFKDLVIEFASLLQYFPEIGSLEQVDKQIRGFVIHRRLKVFYRIKKDSIIVLRLFDTRQHPDKR